MNEVVVLIGAGSIGRAIARRVAAGRTIYVADLRSEAAEQAAEALRSDGYEVQTGTVDVSDAESVARAAADASQLGAISHVIQAAGVSPVQASPAQIVAVDLVGTALVLEQFGQVVASGGAGIVISSQAGHMIPPLDAETNRALAWTPTAELAALPMLTAIDDTAYAYALAKRANSLRVQAAALTWGDRGARVTSISPGIVMTPLARDEMSGPAGPAYRQMIDTSPAGRVSSPDEIADAAAFLMGAPFITGADLLIDGGVVATIAGGRYSFAGL